jgi:peptidoglycan/xylan/chitin deacetylase (PgdA/CDA1 family)
MSVARRVLATTMRNTAMAYDTLRPPPAGAVLLAYHRIGGGSESSVDLDPGVFDEQLAYLREHHTVAGIDETVDRLTTPAATGLHVVVTFDDGTADFVDTALPLLCRHGVPATLYLATAFVGGRFPWGAPALSWAGLRDAVSTGLVTVASHTHNHRVMDKADAAGAEDEAVRSIEAIEDELARRPRHFAYPKGVAGTGDVPGVLAAHFDSLAGAEVGVNRWGDSDLRYLRRTPIVTSDSPAWFRRKAGGGLYLEGRARAAMNRVRYRRATV